VRIAYFCLQSWIPVTFAYDLDLIQENLDAGHEVHVVRPSSTLRFSDTAPFDASPRRLRRELRRFWKGMDLLSAPPRVHSVDSLVRFHRLSRELRRLEIPPFSLHEELDAFCFHGHDAGNAVLSSLISSTRDSLVDLTHHRDFVERALDTSLKVYVAARAFIERRKPDRVVLYNGRMATFRGVLRACQETGTDCLVHERAATLNRVALTDNTMPHDPVWVVRQITETWENGEHPLHEKRVIGRSFYERKRSADGLLWDRYTEAQETGRLPFHSSEGRPVYSIFTSSESERIALKWYYRYLLHESQLDGILDVIRILEEHDFPGLLCIRIHPNSRSEKPNLREQLEGSVKQDFVRIIGADSPVDTYALIDASEKVITFGSTVSMEAAYWGKPTILLGTGIFGPLDSVYHPKDRDEAVQLIVKPLESRATEDALKYGYYQSVFGRPLRHARPVELMTCYFKGEALHARNAARPRWRSYLRNLWLSRVARAIGGVRTRGHLIAPWSRTDQTYFRRQR
jgi:hypothetical protein